MVRLADMLTTRLYHAFAVLRDGRVFVAGGGRSRAPRVDDARLRDRAGRWHASAHQLALDVVVGKSATELSRALLLGAGWVISLAVAEWHLHRRRSKPTRRALVRAAGVAQ